MFKKFIIAALVGLPALLPTLVSASELRTASYTIDYDLDATSITYCAVTGKFGDAFGRPMEGGDRITTSGSSTTTTEFTASAAPFTTLNVGDILIVDPGTGPANVLRRVITAKASGSSVTVNTAWDLSATAGYNFYWLKNNCGTAATSGWISVAGAAQFVIDFQIDQVNVTGGIDMRIECRGNYIGAQPVQVFPSCTSGACATVQNYSGIAGITSHTSIVTTASFGECRVGILIHTSDDGGDTGANAEQLNIGLTLYER